MVGHDLPAESAPNNQLFHGNGGLEERQRVSTGERMEETPPHTPQATMAGPPLSGRATWVTANSGVGKAGVIQSMSC